MLTCLLLHVSFNIMLLLILYTQHTHKVGNVGNIKLLITKLLFKSVIIITVYNSSYNERIVVYS